MSRIYEPICWYCGAESTGAARHLHEDWKYHQDSCTARLAGLRTICRLCHFVKHPGMVAKLVAEGYLPIEIFGELEAHFCQVNCCPSDAYRRHCEAERLLFGALQQIGVLHIDLGELSNSKLAELKV